MKDLFGIKKTDGVDNTKSLKVAYIAYRTIQVAVLLYCGYEIYLRITTGRPISNLLLYFLLLTAPAGIYRIIATRNERKGNAEELKKHDKMILRSVLIAVAIMLCVIIVTVLYAINR